MVSNGKIHRRDGYEPLEQEGKGLDLIIGTVALEHIAVHNDNIGRFKCGRIHDTLIGFIQLSAMQIAYHNEADRCAVELGAFDLVSYGLERAV